MAVEAHNLNDSPRTILVVDDFDDTRLLLRTWLKRKGFRVIEADNGMQAVAAARNLHPGFIISELPVSKLLINYMRDVNCFFGNINSENMIVLFHNFRFKQS